MGYSCCEWAKIEFWACTHMIGHEVAQLVEALRYKSEGRGFD